MVLAADLSVRLGLLKVADAEKLTSIISKLHLPVEPPKFGVDRYMELMAIDKKAEGGEIRYILLDGLGRSKISVVNDDLVAQTLFATGAA